MEDADEIALKIIMCGSAGVGKTSLLKRYLHNTFTGSEPATLGGVFASQTTEIDGRQVKVRIWDTAGEEQTRSLTRQFFVNANACLLVFDITDRASFLAVPSWLEDVRTQAGADTVVLCVGAKVDREDERRVTTEEAVNQCAHYGMGYAEVSALTGARVELPFQQLIRHTVYTQFVCSKADDENASATVRRDAERRELERAARTTSISLAELQRKPGGGGNREKGGGGCC